MCLMYHYFYSFHSTKSDFFFLMYQLIKDLQYFLNIIWTLFSRLKLDKFNLNQEFIKQQQRLKPSGWGKQATIYKKITVELNTKQPNWIFNQKTSLAGIWHNKTHACLIFFLLQLSSYYNFLHFDRLSSSSSSYFSSSFSSAINIVLVFR